MPQWMWNSGWGVGIGDVLPLREGTRAVLQLRALLHEASKPTARGFPS